MSDLTTSGSPVPNGVSSPLQSATSIHTTMKPSNAGDSSDGSGSLAVPAKLGSSKYVWSHEEAGPDVASSRSLDASRRIRGIRETFLQAVQYLDADDSQAAEDRFASAIEDLRELWSFAAVRGEAFTALVALIDAAVRRKSIVDFTREQIEVLKDAWFDLSKSGIDHSDITEHITRFAQSNIDVTRPIQSLDEDEFEILFRKVQR